MAATGSGRDVWRENSPDSLLDLATRLTHFHLKRHHSILTQYTSLYSGEGAKIKGKKTSVSFAFTHTYTLEKLTFFLFFPKHTWKIKKNCKNAKTKQKTYIVPYYLWLTIGAPCGQNITPYDSKPIF